MQYNISEIYYSIQGEGASAGQPCIFVRFSGCNLRCKWCDTPYTSFSPEVNLLSFKQVCKKIDYLIKNYGVRYICFTGGEPSLYDLTPFTEKYKGYKLGIESNGTLPIKGDFTEIVFSPKLKNSEQQKGYEKIAQQAGQNVKNYPNAIFKFVIRDKEDLDDILLFCSANGIKRERVWLMPEGIKASQIRKRLPRIFTICKRYGFNLSSRLQIFAWGNKRRK